MAKENGTRYQKLTLREKMSRQGKHKKEVQYEHHGSNREPTGGTPVPRDPDIAREENRKRIAAEKDRPQGSYSPGATPHHLPRLSEYSSKEVRKANTNLPIAGRNPSGDAVGAINPKNPEPK